MIQYLYDNDIILYTYGALCGLGLLFRFIVNMVYKHLVKESDDVGKAKNKMLKYLKLKFEACYRLKIGVNNVDSFVDKNVLKYRFCGLLLSTWENLCGQILILNLLIVPILGVFGVIYNCGQDKILFLGAVGIASSAVLILVDKSINLSNKKKMFRTNLLDYLENFCKVRLEQEAKSPELVEQHRREFMQVADANKQISATVAAEPQKEEMKDELNRRREARRKKEEERKLLVAKREEEQRKAEEARREEEKKKLEERKQLAVKRREEERMRLEEERQALEERRAELKRKAQEKQLVSEQKKQIEEEKAEHLHKYEEEEKPSEEKDDTDILISGLEEIAADKERDKPEKVEVTKSHNPVSKAKSHAILSQEEKLIEDVLKDFFA